MAVVPDVYIEAAYGTIVRSYGLSDNAHWMVLSVGERDGDPSARCIALDGYREGAMEDWYLITIHFELVE